MASMAKYETRSPDNEKAKKYDRQLRLWGDHGQFLLENAHVCLINATAVGTETLKGLVLPGVGNFTIVDGHRVSGEDVGKNFFLTKDCIGANRGEAACKLLAELNPHVRGHVIDEDCDSLLVTNPQEFSRFSVVVATGLPESTLLKLSRRLHEERVPLLVCRAYGQIGYLRLQTPEHTIVEARPDNDFDDLRITAPFAGLREYVNSVKLDQLDKAKHAHVPYVVILLKALDRWWEKNGADKLPSSRDKDLRDIINSMRYKVDPNDTTPHVEPLNFDQTLKSLGRCLRPVYVPAEVKALFTDPACENLTPESAPFWIMVRALRDFVKVHGYLPVRGAIPDMVSDTESYVQLASVYKREADAHVEEVWKMVGDLITELAKPQGTICEHDVRILCRNAHTLAVIRTRPLFEELECPNAQYVNQKLQDTSLVEEPDIIYYVLLRAVDRFYEELRRYPGFFRDEMETDIHKLKAIVGRLVQEWGIGPLSKDDFIHEMCRFGACELHTIASVVGGCAAQEVVKIITHQYVPFNNTYIFNGITCTSETYEL
ncbi:NEDD8-activating enzyme E1 regulatory subunit-like [Tropilaelaps mercedesae]|uniref:NEDD8-activating enzyme E1 regulatory subunit n=1 Tax=Tropilaelaps mercedesae TaxID=418985 RepID=A0A1V9X5G0_9ACAR|nr:NEDD8-activating enzyme E1 regulatory subunit-like [Tropilaelaps mercedesae]